MMLTSLILLATFISIVFPLVTILWLWKGKFTSRVDWALKVLASASVVVFFSFAGPWAFTSIWLKYILKILFVIAAVMTFPRLEDRAIFSKRNSKGRVSYKPRAVFLAVFLVLDLITIKGRYFKGEPLELSFPMKDGRYYVIQGGANPILNPFHRSTPAEAYALDIVKLNFLGNRAGGLFPSELSGHKVFGEILYSPCSGKVAGAVDSLADTPPRTPDESNPAGNHIIIECGDAEILLAHLMNGSVTVKEGQYVKENQVIARVGNSGNSFEPHLHISAHMAQDPGKAVPLTFRGEFLVMNKGIRN